MSEFDIRYQEYVIKNNLQGKTEQEVLTHMEQSGWLSPEEAQTLRTSGAFSVGKTLTQTHTDEFQSTQNTENTQSQLAPQKIVLTEEQAQEQVISTVVEDVIDARNILMQVDNGIITKGYDKLKTKAFEIKKAGKEEETREDIERMSFIFGGVVGYLVSTYLYDKTMDVADYAYSNVEENVALQAVGADNMQLAKNKQLSKKEYYLQNKEHLKTMLIRRLYMKNQKSGDSFIDRNRGNLSQEEFGKFLENYINDMVDKLQDLDSIKTMQRGLTALSPEQTEQYYQKLLENAKNQPPKKVGEINITIKMPEVPFEFNTTEPISFEEVFKYERGTEFSKDNVQYHIQKETDFNYVLGAYNKHQVLKNAVDEYRQNYNRQIALSSVATAEMGGTIIEPSPTEQAKKVTTIFEEYFANPVNPNFAKEKLEEVISKNKLPILVNSNEAGELSLDLSALSSDSAKNRALNNILSLLMQEQNGQLEEIMGGNPEDRMLAYRQNYNLSREFAYGSEYSKSLAEAMDNDNKTVIKRVTGDVSSAGMGMTVVGGVLCFTPLAPLGATLLTAGNATAITGMVSESALGYTEALTRNDISEEELIEITKTTLMNAGGFGVGMVAGKLGMKAFGNIIDDKLATVFNQEIAMGNRAGALKAVFCDPNNLANFMQAAGAKVGTDFLISYAGDLAMMGVLGTQDDWQSLLKSNLIGIMVGMSSDIKDVSGANGRFGSAKPKPETQSTKPAIFGAIVRNTEPETRETTQNSHQTKLDETKNPNTEPVAPKGELEEPHAKNSSETNEAQNTNRTEESKPSTSIEEMHAKIENIDIRNEQVVDEIIAEWRADMEKALDVKNNDEYRAILDYTSKKYDVFASKIEELCMDSDPEIANLAMDILMNKLAPLAEDFQKNIFSVVDNRPEIKGAYGQTVKTEDIDAPNSKDNTNNSNPLRPKQFETTDAYKLTEVVSEANLARVGAELLTTVNGKKVLTPEADEMVRNIANQIHNLALKEESGIVDTMIKMGFGTEETLRHRSKSVQSTYDKIKNALIDDEKCSLKDAVGTVFDGVGVRTVSTIDNFANHPTVKKYLDAGDFKTAYQKAVELESNFVLESLMKYVDLCAEGKNEVTLTRISNYMGEDGIPYFTEKQLQKLKAYAISKKVNLPIVERVMDYTERTQATTESAYRKKATTKVRGSGYTALQMNFVTKDGFSYEWQYRKEKVDAFAEGEHIPYDLRTNKDIIGTHTELTRLYEPIKDLLTNKEKMPDTKFDEYNYYLTAHYEYLRLVELGLEDMADAPKLPKGFDERLRAENLELIHEIAEKIKKEPHKEAEYLKEYEERLVRNTDENTTTKSYTQEAKVKAENRTINQNEAETRLGANREGADLNAISRIINACKNSQGAITDKLIGEAEFLMAQGVKTDNIIQSLYKIKNDEIKNFANEFLNEQKKYPNKNVDKIIEEMTNNSAKRTTEETTRLLKYNKYSDEQLAKLFEKEYVINKLPEKCFTHLLKSTTMALVSNWKPEFENIPFDKIPTRELNSYVQSLLKDPSQATIQTNRYKQTIIGEQNKSGTTWFFNFNDMKNTDGSFKPEKVVEYLKFLKSNGSDKTNLFVNLFRFIDTTKDIETFAKDYPETLNSLMSSLEANREIVLSTSTHIDANTLKGIETFLKRGEKPADIAELCIFGNLISHGYTGDKYLLSYKAAGLSALGNSHLNNFSTSTKDLFLSRLYNMITKKQNNTGYFEELIKNRIDDEKIALDLCDEKTFNDFTSKIVAQKKKFQKYGHETPNATLIAEQIELMRRYNPDSYKALVHSKGYKDIEAGKISPEILNTLKYTDKIDENYFNNLYTNLEKQIDDLIKNETTYDKGMLEDILLLDIGRANEIYNLITTAKDKDIMNKTLHMIRNRQQKIETELTSRERKGYFIEQEDVVSDKNDLIDFIDIASKYPEAVARASLFKGNSFNIYNLANKLASTKLSTEDVNRILDFYSKKGVNANEVDRSINFVEKFGDIDMLFKINDYISKAPDVKPTNLLFILNNISNNNYDYITGKINNNTYSWNDMFLQQFTKDITDFANPEQQTKIINDIKEAIGYDQYITNLGKMTITTERQQYSQRYITTRTPFYYSGLIDMKINNPKMFNKIKESGLIERVERGQIPTKALRNLNKNSDLSDAVYADLKALKEGRSIVPEFKGISLKEAFQKTKVGDAVEVDGKMYINDGKKLIEWEMTKEKYLELFPPVSRFTTCQQAIGDCYFVTSLASSMENPYARVNLYKSFKQQGNDIIVTVKSYENYGGSNTFTDSKITLPDENTHIIGCKGLQMYEQTYAKAAFRFDEKDPTPILPKHTNPHTTMHRIEGGWAFEAMSEIHGIDYIPREDSRQNIKWVNDVPDVETFSVGILHKPNDATAEVKLEEYITKYVKDDSMVKFATISKKNSEAESSILPEFNLVSNHAYSISGYDPKTKTVSISNPHNASIITKVPLATLSKYIAHIYITKF